ncbi:MAG: WD40 repeat domain-containing protein [Verrucomicrobiota bacterium]
MAFSPDGSLLLTTYRDPPRVRVWSVRERSLVGTFTGHRLPTACAAFTRDGKAIVSGGGIGYSRAPGELKLWNATTFEEIHGFEGTEFSILWCDVSPDGRLVGASGAGPLVMVWDFQTRRLVARLTGHDAQLKGGVRALCFSPDGRYLATGDFGGTVRLWNLQTLEPVVLGTHMQPVFGLAFSPDSKRLASGSRDHTLKVWNLTKPGESLTLRGHRTRVMGVTFSNDGKTVMAGGLDGTVKFWSASLPSEANVIAHTKGDGAIGYSADGRLLAWQEYDDKAVSVWGVASERMVHRVEGWNGLFSPAGNVMVVVAPTGRVRFWDTTAWEEVRGQREIIAQMDDGVSLAYSPDGESLAVIHPQGAVTVWDVRRWKETARIPCVLRNGWMLFSAGGQSLLTPGRDHAVDIWKIATGQRSASLVGHELRVRAAAFSPDGRLLATGSEDTTVRLWDYARRREIGRWIGGLGAICSVAFSKDGKTLATGSYEGVIQLWNVASGHTVGELQGHLSFVRSLAFSPDGSTLASSSMDNTIRLWKALSLGEK